MEGDGAWWWVFWLVKMVLRSEGGGMLREKAECQCCRGMLGLVGDGWWCDRWGIKCLKKLVIVFFTKLCERIVSFFDTAGAEVCTYFYQQATSTSLPT